MERATPTVARVARTSTSLRGVRVTMGVRFAVMGCVDEGELVRLRRRWRGEEASRGREEGCEDRALSFVGWG